MRTKLLALIVWAMLRAAKGNAGYEMNVYRESPGVYFEDLGHATLSNTAWTIVIYVPIQTMNSETSHLEQYVHYIDKICSRMIIKNWTACSYFGDIMAHKLQQIKNTQRLLYDIGQGGEGNRRHKRGLFNFVGNLSKTLFDIMDNDDVQFCHDQIERFEQGTTTLTQLAKRQLIIVKSTLCTFNETLTDIEYNEKKMREGLSKLQMYVATFGSQVENATYLLSLKITIEDHIAKALDPSHAIQRTLDILVDSIADAQKGSLPPCVIPPTLLLDTLKSSSPSFPADTTLPFPLGKDYLHSMYQLSDVRVYTYKECLEYVITVPLVHKKTFTVLRMIPIPVPVNQEHFLYVDVRDSVLCLDRARQYYFTMSEDELPKCKLAELGYYVCTHQCMLLSTLTTESCAVTMLQRKNSLPPVCDTRLVRLSNTVWTQLTNNSWIYFAPHPDIMTILCHNNNPVDVRLKGVGKLQVHPGCKGYSTSTLLYGSSIVGNTSAQITGDLLSQIDLQYACCEELGVKVNFSQLPMEVAHRKVVAHLDDLRYASRKVLDLLEEVNEQEWKNNHLAYRNTYSVLLFVVASVIFAYLLYKLYTCTRNRNTIWFCREKAPVTPTDVSYIVGQGDQECTVNINGRSSEDNMNVTDAVSPPTKRASHPRVAKSYF